MHLVSSEMTLLEALEQFYPESSRRTLQQWIKAKRIFVEDQIVSKATHKIEPGQTITLGKKDLIRTFYKGVEILYQDRWLVAIDKPHGLLSVPSENPEKQHAMGLLREYFQSPSILPVHRIDRDTSGVLLFARGGAAQERLDLLFETHAIDREYLALIEGRLNPEKGKWESYLLEKDNFDVVTTTAEKGKLAITHYEVYRRSKNFSFLRLKLETGKKHQIRVHCKEAGHPIVGDARYGSLCNPVGRLCLHAHLLGFTHPFTGKRIQFVSPCPRIFERLGMHL